MWRLLLLFALLSLAFAKKADYTGHRLISVHAQNRDDVEALARLQDSEDFVELDFWSEPSIVRSTDIRVSPNEYGKLRAALSKAKLIYTVVKDNIQEFVDKEEESMARNNKLWRNAAGCDPIHNYCRYEVIQTYLYNLEQDAGGLVTVFSIGSSFENRPIMAVKIALDPTYPKRAIWIECGTHPREWIGISSCVSLIDQLSYGGWMVEAFDWYVVPVHNPDGYEYTHTSNRMWRKNRQQQSCIFGNDGTDLNRNWDIDFGKAGTSNSCWHDLYGGRNAFSAPETVALRDAVNHTANVFAFFSVHCYSQLMLVPYAYTSDRPASYNESIAIAKKMMARLKLIDGKTFEVGAPPDILYAASGGAYDYIFDVLGVPYSYTYELRPATADEGGFVLDAYQIMPSAAELIASLQGFVDEFL